jgi:glutamine synthetase
MSSLYKDKTKIGVEYLWTGIDNTFVNQLTNQLTNPLTNQLTNPLTKPLTNNTFISAFTNPNPIYNPNPISNPNTNINITKKRFFTKVRSLELKMSTITKPTLNDIPVWSFDGSSTGHVIPNSANLNTEVMLKPVKLFEHPFASESIKYLVLCDIFDINGQPNQFSTRSNVIDLFKNNTNLQPWYGLEQEYVFMDTLTNNIYGWNMNPDEWPKQNDHYCHMSVFHKELRPIVEEHYKKCLSIGINISGFNAEVMPSQWEFQIGPSCGIDAADELTVARYILERLAESNDMYINYHSKPLNAYNGSGCHHNFSTVNTRNLTESNYQQFYSGLFEKFCLNHKQTLDFYGTDNNLRLTGIHETSSMEIFSYGIGTRHTSIRVPVNTYTYFEDRRPSASIDPYISTWVLLSNYLSLFNQMKN